MIAADAAPAVAPPPAAAEVIVARHEDNAVVASRDVPLTLVKAGRREDALVRQALFVTASVTLVRPAGNDALPARYRWTHQAYLQRQICFTSITGLFACAAAQVEALPDKATGTAPADGLLDTFPQADADQRRLAEQLHQRAATMFGADRRANIDPIFKAAGAIVTSTAGR